MLAWLDCAALHLQRRNGYHIELPPPEAAIPPEEDAVSIVVVASRSSLIPIHWVSRFQRGHTTEKGRPSGLGTRASRSPMSLTSSITTYTFNTFTY